MEDVRMLIDKATSIIHLIVNNNKQVLKANMPAGVSLFYLRRLNPGPLPAPPLLLGAYLFRVMLRYLRVRKLFQIVRHCWAEGEKKIGEGAKDTHTKRGMYYQLLSLEEV